MGNNGISVRYPIWRQEAAIYDSYASAIVRIDTLMCADRPHRT